MIAYKNTISVVEVRNYVEIVDIEHEEEKKKEETDEFQRQKEVRIVAELYRHPWYIKYLNFLFLFISNFIS